MFKCKYCGSKNYKIIKRNIHHGLYCGECGKWIKWLNKNEKIIYKEV